MVLTAVDFGQKKPLLDKGANMTLALCKVHPLLCDKNNLFFFLLTLCFFDLLQYGYIFNVEVHPCNIITEFLLCVTEKASNVHVSF